MLQATWEKVNWRHTTDEKVFHEIFLGNQKTPKSQQRQALPPFWVSFLFSTSGYEKGILINYVSKAIWCLVSYRCQELPLSWKFENKFVYIYIMPRLRKAPYPCARVRACALRVRAPACLRVRVCAYARAPTRVRVRACARACVRLKICK